MRVGDGVDDEFAEVEVGGEVAELEGYSVGGAYEVAGVFAFFGGVECGLPDLLNQFVF